MSFWNWGYGNAEVVERLDTIHDDNLMMIRILNALDRRQIKMERFAMATAQETQEKLDAALAAVEISNQGTDRLITMIDELRTQGGPVTQEQLDALYATATQIKDSAEAQSMESGQVT